MSETEDESLHTHIAELANADKEYILSNGQELYNFLQTEAYCEALADTIVKYWDYPSAYFAYKVKKQLIKMLDEETTDRVRERLYG
jgi:F0F1-type ATP synthase gamma subunit